MITCTNCATCNGTGYLYVQCCRNSQQAAKILCGCGGEPEIEGCCPDCNPNDDHETRAEVEDD